MPVMIRFVTAFAVLWPLAIVYLGLKRDKGDLVITIGTFKKRLAGFRRKEDWHWTFSLALSGLFTGIPAILYLWRYTAISSGSLVLLFLGCGALGGVQWWYIKKFISDREFALYVFAGAAIWGTAAILSLNYMVPISYSTTREFAITDRDQKSLSGGRHGGTETYAYELFFEENAFADYNSFRTFGQAAIPRDFYEYDHVTLTWRRGLFGFIVLRNYKFSP
jgi:hypothetical protein